MWFYNALMEVYLVNPTNRLSILIKATSRGGGETPTISIVIILVQSTSSCFILAWNFNLDILSTDNSFCLVIMNCVLL
uniref:Uncharacterized protein n=1 Tax=Leersia perrieri TaxID=77586 RepID=A0A0D9XQ13_9ORYZ